MTIRRGAAPKRDFTILVNSTINDARLSFRALGVLTFLLSKPENWTVDASALSMGEGREGRDAIRKALNELEEAGYLRREKTRLKGRFITESVVYDTPRGPVENEEKDQVAPATKKPSRSNRQRSTGGVFQAQVTSDGRPVANKRKETRTESSGDSSFSSVDNLPRHPEPRPFCETCDGWSDGQGPPELLCKCPNVIAAASG